MMKSISVVTLCILISAIAMSFQPAQSEQSSSLQELAAASIKLANDDIAFAFGGGCRGIDDTSSGGVGNRGLSRGEKAVVGGDTAWYPMPASAHP